MPHINDLFIDVVTSGVTDVTLETDSYWGADGLPIISVTSVGNCPDGMTLKTILYPSGDLWDTTTLLTLLSENNSYTLNDYITNSGYYYGPSYLFGSGKYNTFYHKEHHIAIEHANTYYMLGHTLAYYNEAGLQVYAPESSINDNAILSKANKPQVNNININANLYSAAANTSDLWLRIYRTTELTNSTLSDPYPYLVIISGIEDQSYYDISGNIIGEEYGNNNYFSESTVSGMFLSIPYISGTQEPYTYDISLINVDQDSDNSPYLSFTTESINTSSDDFNEGELELYDNINVKPDYVKIGEIPIKNDVVAKKRLMVGIEDAALMSSQFTKKGIYVSEYYNVDDPIYTFSLKSAETIPDIQGLRLSDVIKYYVQFHSQDWIRVSPITRGEEYEENKFVPKFLVLDKLNLGGISTEIAEYSYDFPVYSLRVKIEIDMSAVTSTNFLSPMVLYYECHVTDRNYALGSDNE
jgi:hypothetical protein